MLRARNILLGVAIVVVLAHFLITVSSGIGGPGEEDMRRPKVTRGTSKFTRLPPIGGVRGTGSSPTAGPGAVDGGTGASATTATDPGTTTSLRSPSAGARGASAAEDPEERNEGPEERPRAADDDRDDEPRGAKDDDNDDDNRSNDKDDDNDDDASKRAPDPEGEGGGDGSEGSKQTRAPAASAPKALPTPKAPARPATAADSSWSRSRSEPRPEPVRPAAVIPTTNFINDDGFVAAVAAAAVDRTVVVGVGDAGFLPMLVNFIETSVVRFGLRNYLVVALESNMCSRLPLHNGAVTCFFYPEGERLRGGSFGTREFARLVNLKSEIVMATVQLGYDTLLVDGDIVFLKDPLPLLKRERDFDVQIQDDAEAERNSGFMFIRATPWGLAFIGRAVRIAQQAKDMRQQPAVNKALKELSRSPLRVKVLSTTEYPCGKAYYEKPRRMFAHEHPCEECVILHNNWIVGTAAKVYRFKESLQWLVDEPNAYYSSETARYLEFGNPDPNVSRETEMEALKTAFKIGKLLNRIPILPPFHCHGCVVVGLGGVKQGCQGAEGDANECALHAHFDIDTFNKVLGPTSYRERMFRYNPLTPPGVHLSSNIGPTVESEDMLEASPSTPYFIVTEEETVPRYGANRVLPADQIATPANVRYGPTANEIREWFGGFRDEPVLRFHSLYNVHVHLESDAADREFDLLWKKALKKSSVRQYK